MLEVMVKFRDEDGKVRRGELANPFRVMVEPCGEIVDIEQENPADVDILTFDGETLGMYRIPTLAIIEIEEVVPA